MAGDIVAFEVPAALQEKYAKIFGTPDKALSEGVSASYGIISFKGKVWRVKYKGEERIVKNADGDPQSALTCVLVMASPQISKIYYPGSYTEGDNDAPTCYSIDGVKPDTEAAEPQSPTCASCPRAVYGSRITEAGKKAKACSDNRRVAVVPFPDLRNESFGGPLLLRVPPASLAELATYGESLFKMGIPYQAVVTKISFDMEAAYPKLKFQALAGLDDEQAAVIKELMEGDVVNRMLAEAPITEDVETPSQATAATKTAGPAEAAPAQEKKSDAAAEVVSEAPTTDSAATAEPTASEDTTGDSSEKVEKPTPKEANAVEAKVVDDELSSMLSSLM